jgi:AraC-like DNA-binding protein
MFEPRMSIKSIREALFPIHYVEIADSLVRSRGASVANMYTQCGIRPEDMVDAGATINGTQLKALLDVALQHCLPGEPPALQILRHFPLTAHGTLGMLTITSETIGDALEAALLFYPLIIPAFAMTREILPNGVFVRLDRVLDFGAHNDLLTELVMGCFHNVTPYAMVKGLSSIVQFKHRPPEGHAHYSAFFGAPVTFGAPHNALFVPQAMLQQRLLTSNRTTRAVLEAALLRQASAAPQFKPVTQRVRRILSVSLSGGSLPSADQIGSELAMSTRTLSRRLHEEGATLNGLTEQIRIERAERLLLTTTGHINEVGRKVGFQGASSFARAFKRVTGQTPNELRERTSSAKP